MKKMFVFCALLGVFLAACSAPQMDSAPQIQKESMEDAVMMEEESAQMMKQTDMEMTGEMMELAKALEMGKSVKCTTAMDEQVSTLYFAGERMRMDTMPSDAHGIYLKDVIYTWTGNQGIMMKMEAMKETSDVSGEPHEMHDMHKMPTKDDIVQENVDIKCEPFSVPESMFVPPSSVNFQDMSEMMKQLEQMQGSMPK